MDETTLPLLSAEEARTLGVLVEKAALTPDAYPLTVNAVQLGANQKTSREPVLDLDAGTIGHALRTLEDKHLVRVVHGARALRYEHRMDETLRVTPKQRALVAMMLLRGPQTLSELATRTERLASFSGLDDVSDTLERLTSRKPSLAVRIPRGPGQREDRYMHLLCGAVSFESARALPEREPRADRAGPDETTARLDVLEAQVASLEARLAALEGSSR